MLMPTVTVQIMMIMNDDNEDDNWKVKGLFTYSPSGSIDRSSESM